jgi:hypothetical protein
LLTTFWIAVGLPISSFFFNHLSVPGLSLCSQQMIRASQIFHNFSAAATMGFAQFGVLLRLR